MTTEHGIAHCKRRLSAATTLDGLRKVWDQLGRTYQASSEVNAHKDRCKEALTK